MKLEIISRKIGITYLESTLKSNGIGTPAAQIHDFSHRLFLGPQNGIRNSRRRLSRELLGLIIRPDIVLGMLMH